MVKLCRACGYINRDDALECEECHSLFDDKLNSLVNNNDNNEIDNDSLENYEYQPSKIISISDIIKQNNEDVISDQNQYVPNDTTNVNINNSYEDLSNDYNKEDDSPQYVSDFLYSKNGETENIVLDENQFIGNPEENNEFEQNYNDSDDVSSFLYNTNQNTSDESTSSFNIDDDFEQTSVVDFLYENPQNLSNNETDNTIELNEDFDAEADVTDILYSNNKNNTTEENQIEDKPFDIIYDNNQSNDISNFLYSNHDNSNNNDGEQTIDNSFIEEVSSNNNDVLEEISVSSQETYYNNNIYQPADADDLYVPYNEQLSDYSKKESSVINEVVDDSIETEKDTTNTDVIVDELSSIEDDNKEIDSEEQNDVLEAQPNDSSNIKEFGTLSNKLDENDYFISESSDNNTTVLSENDINEVVNNELKDATYMQDLDISNILSYGSDEEITDDTLNNIDVQDNTQTTKTGLLDTLKQIFSFSSSSSKELSKEEIENELYNNKENDVVHNENTTNISLEETADNVNNDNPGPLENFGSNNITSSKTKSSGFTNIKPMEIRRKNVENINKAIKTNEDEDLADAFKVFESAGTYKKEDDSPETVVYDLSSNDTSKTEKKINETAIPNEDVKKDSKKSKLLSNKKQKIQKPISKKNAFLKRSIALSIAVAIIVVTIIVISRINKEKELNAYVARLAANNDVSYSYLDKSLEEKGYSEEERFKAIQSLNIDFSENALNVLYTIAEDSNKLSSKEDARKVLESKGFANSEIERAMTLADWSKYLNTYIEACIAKTKELDKGTIIKSIENAGFTSIEIEYVKKNSDWTKLAKKNLDSYLNNDENELHTKEDAREYLIEKGYSEQDIDDTFKNYEWDVYAYQYLQKYLKKKEDDGVAIDSSRITYTKILEDAKFDENEIELVMGRFDFASYATSKIDTIINDGSNFVEKSKIKESLEKEGYTEDEIEKALKETDWNATAISSLKSLDNRKLSKKEMIQKLKDAGYDDNEITYVEKNYDWIDQANSYLSYLRSEMKNGNEEHLRSLLKEQNYSVEEIDKLIQTIDKNFDYFTNAAKEDVRNISSSNNYSRNKAKTYLKELNYGDTEISAVLNSEDWSSKAISFIKGIDYISRADARNALQKEDFRSSEIESAISSIPSSTWLNLCSSYAKSIYNQNDNDTKCQDYRKYSRGEETSIEQTLKNSEYTSNEISNAMINLFVPAPCNLSD